MVRADSAGRRSIMSAIVDAFPRRPLRLAKNPKRTRNRALLLVTALLLTLPSLYWGNIAWQSGQLRRDLRANGVQAVNVSDSRGDCASRRNRLSGTSNPISCEVTLSYELRPEEGGGTRTATLHLDGRMPIFTPSVYYDPADPGRAMLKPEMERAMQWDELLGPILLLIIPGIVFLIWLFGGRRGLKQAAANPEPIIVPIEKVIRAPAKMYIHSRPPGAPRAFVDTFPAPTQPLLVRPPEGSPGEQQWALALLHPKGRSYLLDSELAWLDLTDQERAAVLAAAWG
jgi:hypothetical protein